jgi:hypothetical protein
MSLLAMERPGAAGEDSGILTVGSGVGEAADSSGN